MSGKKHVARAVYGLYIVVVAAFVVSNVAQVAHILFFSPPESEAAIAAAPKVSAPCAAKLSEQIVRIERARAVASEASNADEARASYARERQSADDRANLEQSCAADPHGIEALAALARLDRASKARAGKSANELTSVRLAAQSFISGHPR